MSRPFPVANLVPTQPIKIRLLMCACYLGVAGMPLFLALSLSPILSIQVPQLKRFPPLTKPVAGSTLTVTLNPEKEREKAQTTADTHTHTHSSTFISHIHVDLGPSVSLPEGNPLQVALQGLLYHIVQRLLLHADTSRQSDAPVDRGGREGAPAGTYHLSGSAGFAVVRGVHARHGAAEDVLPVRNAVGVVLKKRPDSGGWTGWPAAGTCTGRGHRTWMHCSHHQRASRQL